MTRYLLCTLPRSGSNLLSHLLASTDRLGMRDCETAGAEHLLEWVRSCPRKADWSQTTPREFFEERFAASATSNGVAGFKVMWEDLDLLLQQAAAATDDRNLRPERVESYLPPDVRFIRLVRRDQMRQAVSWEKAAQTQAWTSSQVSSVEPVYDFLKLQWTLEEIHRHESAWDRFFQAAGAEPLTFFFEDFVRDPSAVVREIGRYLDVDVEDFKAPARPQLRPQADRTNEEWLARFERDRSGTMARATAAFRTAFSSVEPWKRAIHAFTT